MQAGRELGLQSLGHHPVEGHAAGGDHRSLIADIAFQRETPALQRRCYHVEMNLHQLLSAAKPGDRKYLWMHRGETRNQIPGHELAEQDAAFLLVAQTQRARVRLDFSIQLPDALRKFGRLHSRLEIEHQSRAPAVEHGLDRLTAEPEADRSFDAAVGEIQVAELLPRPGAVDLQGYADVPELDTAELLPQFGERDAPVDVAREFRVGMYLLRQFVALGHQRGQRREGAHYPVAESAGPAVAVAGGTRGRVAQASCGQNQTPALAASAPGQLQAEAAVLPFHGADLLLAEYLHSPGQTGVHEGVHHVGGMVGFGKRPVAALHHPAHAVGGEELRQSLRGEIVECRTQRVRIGAHVRRESVPVLEVGEVAAALAAYHYLACGAWHLLEHEHLGVRAGAHQKVGRGIGSHQPRGAASYNYDV